MIELAVSAGVIITLLVGVFFLVHHNNKKNRTIKVIFKSEKSFDSLNTFLKAAVMEEGFSLNVRIEIVRSNTGINPNNSGSHYQTRYHATIIHSYDHRTDSELKKAIGRVLVNLEPDVVIV